MDLPKPSLVDSIEDDLAYNIPINNRRESLINNRFQSDVTFLVGEKRCPIYAHKLLLIISSEYFNVMFCGNFKESNSKEIEFADVAPEIFLEILRFIYCSTADLTIENALEISVHAEKYMLYDLQHQALDFFKNNITSDNVLKFFAQNRLYELPVVNEKCLSIILKDPLTCFDHDDFYVLDLKSLEIIFRNKKFNCSDTQLLQALLSWNREYETDDKHGLQALISTKLVRNCSKLRFLGKMSKSYQHTDFKFSISHDLALYGIGVFVKTEHTMTMIKVTIFEQNNILCWHEFEYKNKDIATGNVANLFFKKLTLHPDKQYKITVSFNPSSTLWTITYPEICHDMIRIQLPNHVTINSVISHFYYDEIKQ